MTGTALDLPPHFWRRVRIIDGCWEWITPRTDGYGRIQIGWVRKRAHTWAWEAKNGPVPPGLVLDHICRNRACVNPEHLRAVTQRENVMAPGSLAPAKVNAERTHCPRGHAYTQSNTWLDKGRRRCRACRRLLRRKRAEA